MLTIFNEEELKNVVVEYNGKRGLSSHYREDRDEAWNRLVSEGEKAGKSFWNGELYTFEGLMQYDFEHPVLQFGSCEYKDRLFKKKVGERVIEEKYGPGHLQVHCVVSCIPITTDKKLIIGKKKASVDLRPGVYGLISGNLNKDEQEIHTFMDIRSTMKREIEEESSIIVEDERLQFRHISHFNTAVSFEFLYRLNLHSDDAASLHKDEEEFLEFFAFTAQEVGSLREQMTGDFEYQKSVWMDLLNELE